MKKTVIMLLFSILLLTTTGQNNWVKIVDSSTNIEFAMPEAPLFVDTLSTAMYSNAVDSTEALQVHIYRDVSFDNTDPLFNAALIQENGDTLRVIAKLILLTTNSEIISIDEVFTNGSRGVVLGIRYYAFASNNPNTSYIRYYIEKNNFIAFTWTGTQSTMKKVPRPGAPPAPTDPLYKDVFFDSVIIR
jgi:hypothetical protein